MSDAAGDAQMGAMKDAWRKQQDEVLEVLGDAYAEVRGCIDSPVGELRNRLDGVTWQLMRAAQRLGRLGELRMDGVRREGSAGKGK